MPTPLLLGHRGSRSDKSVRENTLAAFDLALEQGCDGFEFDVRLSAAGQAVICHDERVRGVEIARSTADLGSELALPLLQQVLTRYQASAFLDIELKVVGQEGITLDWLKAHPPARGYVVSSFLPAVLENIYDKDAAVPLGLICETSRQMARWTELPVQYVIPHYRLVREKSLIEMQKAGKKVFVWTVNSASRIKQFAAWGVDGIISDHPERLAALREIQS